MTLSFALLLALAAAEPAPAAEAPAKAQRIAVYELELHDVDPRVGRVVTDAIVAELRKLQRLSVIGMDEVRAMLDVEAQKQMVGCADDSCLAQIADALGVDGVVMGSLSRVGDEHVIGLRRLDQREAKAVGTVTQRLQAQSGEEFLAMVGPAIEKLFPDHALRPGMTRGVDPEVALLLNPPPLPTWVFWSCAAGTGALVAGAAGAAGFNAYAVSELSTFTSTGKPVDGAELDRKVGAVTTTGWLAWGFLGGAVVMGAATGVVALFTDWTGAGDFTLE